MVDFYILQADFLAGSGEHQSFRTEERDAKGGVTGRFGYVDPDGALRITEYQADTEGYR